MDDGWTDDMTIALGAGTLPELVELVIDELLAGAKYRTMLETLRERFRLTEEDAALAVDRTCGGIVRAGTSHPDNQPDSGKDPVAFTSYVRTRGNTRLLERLRVAIQAGRVGD